MNQLEMFDPAPPPGPRTRKGIRQGQSDATEYKERGLEAAFSINIGIFQSQFGASRFSYWHFDLNCGSGYNDQVGCIGSPLAFLRATESRRCDRYVAAFCDKDSAALDTLMRREGVIANNRCLLFNGRNASLVAAIPDLIAARGENPKLTVGMVLSDPNGFEVPLDELATLARECPRIDIAIHWNSRLRKLYHGNGWEYVDIDAAMEQLGKRHWLIREPMGDWKWTVLIGRNVVTGDHRGLGYHHLGSPRGADILDRCKVDLARKPSPQQKLAL